MCVPHAAAVFQQVGCWGGKGDHSQLTPSVMPRQWQAEAELGLKMPLRRWKGSCDEWYKEANAAAHGPGMQQSSAVRGCCKAKESVTKVKSFGPEIVWFQHCKKLAGLCVRKRNVIFVLEAQRSELLSSSAVSQTCHLKQKHARS